MMVEFEGKEAIADKETNEVTSYNKGPNFRKSVGICPFMVAWLMDGIGLY